MKYSPHDINPDQQNEINNLMNEFPYGTYYKMLSNTEIPSVIPESLRIKMTHAVLMVEKSTSADIFLICNGVRHDIKDNALDDQTFGVIIKSTGCSTSGYIIQHGNWIERTKNITPEILSVLNSTTLKDYFPLIDTPINNFGPLSDLNKTSHKGAFETFVNKLKQDL